MQVFHKLGDRLVARLVPQVKAAAYSCTDYYKQEDHVCYVRRCCTYASGTRCNGWSPC